MIVFLRHSDNQCFLRLDHDAVMYDRGKRTENGMVQEAFYGAVMLKTRVSMARSKNTFPLC